MPAYVEEPYDLWQPGQQVGPSGTGLGSPNYQGGAAAPGWGSTGTMATPPGGYPTLDTPTNTALTGQTAWTSQTGSGPMTSSKSYYDLSTDPGVMWANYQKARGIADANEWKSAELAGRPRYIGSPAPIDLTTEVEIRQAHEDADAALKQLEHETGVQRATLLDRLAARGLGQSGEVGYQTGELDWAAGTQREGINREVGQFEELARLRREEQLANWRQGEAVGAARAAAAAHEFDAKLNYQYNSRLRSLDDDVMHAYINAYGYATTHPEIYLGHTGAPPGLGLPTGATAGGAPAAPAGSSGLTGSTPSLAASGGTL